MAIGAHNPLRFGCFLLISATLLGCSQSTQQSILPQITPPDPAPIPGPKPQYRGVSPALAARSYRVAEPGSNTVVGSEVVAVELAPLSNAPSTVSAPRSAGTASTQLAQAPTISPAPATGERTYVVRPGDTLYGIARREALPPKAIAVRNHLAAPYALQVGQRLVLPGSTPAKSDTYTVVKGDTLYGIARRHQVAVADLKSVNKMSAPYVISPGQKLAMPTGATAAPQTTAIAQKTPAPKAAPKKQVAQTPVQKTAPKVAEAVEKPAPKPAVTAQPAKAVAAPEPQPAVTLSAPPPRAGNSFLWPVEGKVILGFGPKKNGLQNDGINIAAPRDTPVRAAENGVVAYTGNELRGFGNLVLIKHDAGWTTAYAHVGQVMVRRGDRVDRGQIVGLVGSTGSVSAPQLHFEVRKGTDAVNPMPLLERQTALLSN